MSGLAELERVSKNYGDIRALDDVTLKIRRGEIFTLIGPNGSGKTTLLKILACIEKPDSGNVYINDEQIEDKNRNRAKLSTTLVFQRTTLFSTSVYNNIAYGLKLRKTSKEQIDDAVNQALELVKLEGYENRPAKKLSGGEQQRVSLARALALNTSLLLLDEPTANLDPKSVSIIEEVIKEVNRQKDTAIVMATHNIFQDEHLAEKAALLINGRIVEIGTIAKILGGKSRNLANFAKLENIFSGTSEVLKEGTSRVQFDDGTTIETALRKSGRITVFIRPEDIILSKRQFESSARNVFEGKIVEILDQGSLVRLKVNAKKEFIAQITKRSFVEMDLNVGSQIYLTFKASSVQSI
jgi:tungstate transport system ATP-binding protein